MAKLRIPVNTIPQRSMPSFELCSMLSKLLLHTFDGGDIQQTEQTLAHLERSVQGVLPALLRIVTEKTQIHQNNALAQEENQNSAEKMTQQQLEQVKHAAALRLKNIVQEYWSVREGKDSIIAEADRHLVKENLLEAIIGTTRQALRVQLVSCLFAIVKCDFPDDYPTLYPAVMADITNTNEFDRLCGSIYALHIMMKKYRYKKAEERKPMVQLIELTFPRLLQLLQMATSSPDSIQTHEIIRMILKIFFIGCQISLPDTLRQPDALSPWLEQLVKVVEKPVSSEIDLDEPIVKAKKWAAISLNRMFSLYGRVNRVRKENKQFAQFFFDNYAPIILKSLLNILHAQCAGHFIPPRVLHSTYFFLTNALEYSKLWLFMKPHINFILFDSILRTLCLTDEDISIWQDDPHEFIRRSLDVLEEFHDPRVSGSNLLIDLVKYRTSSTLQLSLATIQQIFERYHSAPPNMKADLLMEGTMRFFGTLNRLLISREDFKQPIEALISQHILPEFKSSNGFLRARACWVIGQFHALKWADQQALSFAVQSICQCLLDSDLPVRLEACTSISRVVYNESVIALVRPHASLIFQQLFQLCDEIGNEEVVSTLNQLLFSFEDDIVPYATQLIQKLTQMFCQYTQNEDDEDASLTALQCLRSINTILYSLERVPKMYLEIEPLLLPIIPKLLTDQYYEYIEDSIELLTCLTYHQSPISDNLWQLIPTLLTAGQTWAADSWEYLISPLDNFLTKDVRRYIQHFLLQTLQVINQFIAEPEREVEAGYVSKLLESLVLNGKGLIDAVIPDLISLVIRRALAGKIAQFKLCMLDNLGALAYYNPALFLHVISRLEDTVIRKVFDLWLKKISKVKESHRHLKIACIGWASLFTVPVTSFPPTLQNGALHLLNTLLSTLSRSRRLFEKIQADRADAEEDAEDSGGDQNDNTNDSDADFADDEDVPEQFLDVPDDQDVQNDGMDDIEQEEALDAVAQAYELEHGLTNEGTEMKGELAPDRDNDDDDDGLTEYELDDDDEYTSPLDDIDETIYFVQMLTSLERDQRAFYGQWSRSLDKRRQQLVRAHHNAALRRQRELDKKALEVSGQPVPK